MLVEMILLFFLFALVFASSSSLTPQNTLRRGSSLTVQKRDKDVLVSGDGVFTAGFHSVGENAFCFAIWFTKSSDPTTLVWMANRDQPVNGKGSRFSLLKDGNLILTDADGTVIWTSDSNDSSATSVQLQLLDTGNLVLNSLEDDNKILWQSFNSPTNTLLPNQEFTRHTTLVSSRSKTNVSSSSYKLFFDNDNVLKLLYDGPEVSSIYWPDPWLLIWDAGRTTFNSSKFAQFDSSGYFKSSDSLEFSSSDYGFGIKRRLTLDLDGNLRLYSLNEMTGNWTVTWQAMSDPCRVHGLCGPNSICCYDSGSGSGCSCLPGYIIKNPRDWSYGCKPEFDHSVFAHIKLEFGSAKHVEFYGYEFDFYKNSTLNTCKSRCMKSSICKGFLFKFEEGIYNCYPKSLLLNGKQYSSLLGTIYFKRIASNIGTVLQIPPVKQIKPNCSVEESIVLERTYKRKNISKYLKFIVLVASVIGCVEIFCIALASLLLYKTNESAAALQGYNALALTGFRRFSYIELKKATRGFSKEIGRGGAGVVYKGVLSDQRIAAVKRLNEEANQEETQFLVEINTVGRLNHMNLIEMWGYCAEGKHRALVYEYMENGSLADNLYSNSLTWEKRFQIAFGTAQGLAYLHEECLEWVFHCDIKPQNILLDENYHPKVADFGLSKLLTRGGDYNSNFSRIRGTRGYMAPEWFFNLPITSKVDVFSYGILVLEMVTGRSPTGMYNGAEDTGHGSLVTYVRGKMMHGSSAEKSWIEQIINPMVCGEYEFGKMETLIRVALQCVEEDRDTRPSMSKVVEMLLCHGN